MAENKHSANTGGERFQFYTEIFLVLLTAGIACDAGLSNFLTASDDLYPAAADVMGNMAAVFAGIAVRSGSVGAGADLCNYSMVSICGPSLCQEAGQAECGPVYSSLPVIDTVPANARIYNRFLHYGSHAAFCSV